MLQKHPLGPGGEEAGRADQDQIDGELARLNFLAHLGHRSAGALAQIVELEILAQIVALDERLGHALASAVGKQRIDDRHRAFFLGRFNQRLLMRRQIGSPGKAGTCQECQRRDRAHHSLVCIVHDIPPKMACCSRQAAKY